MKLHRKPKDKKKFKPILSYLKPGFWDTDIRFGYLK